MATQQNDRRRGGSQTLLLVTGRLAAHAAVMPEQTATELRAHAADAARQARAVLAALADPDDEVTASAATRNRLEGAAAALDAVASGDPVASVHAMGSSESEPFSFLADGEIPWPIVGGNLLRHDSDWWYNACLGWQGKSWYGFAEGYRRAAALIVEHVGRTREDQDFLVWPFTMCWRHHVELQLKQIIPLLHELNGSSQLASHTHSISKLWDETRQLLEQTGCEVPPADLDNAGRVLLQLDKIDPIAEAFRYPVGKSGKISRPSDLEYVHMRIFQEEMERVAHFLDAVHCMLAK